MLAEALCCTRISTCHQEQEEGVQFMRVSCPAVMNDIGTAPLQVVGYEGIFGCLAMFCVLLPIVQHTPGMDGSGLHEDSWETWHVRSSATWAIPTLAPHQPPSPPPPSPPPPTRASLHPFACSIMPAVLHCSIGSKVGFFGAA